MYTATAVLLAVQQGLVALDEPITTYLPGFTVRSSFEQHPEAKITLRHLLTHSAGFTHEAPVGSNYEVGDASFSAHFQSISSTWLRFPVGHHQEYSNLGVDLAAYILQVVSGMPFHSFADCSLLQPLGLHRTTFDLIAWETDRAVGHSRQLGEHLPTRIPMVGEGGVYTTVEDACRYLQFQLNAGGSLLEPGLLAEMARFPGHKDGQTSGYGAGLMVTRAGGALARGHGGRGFGFLADLYWMPVEGFGVAMLTNSVDHPQANVVMGIIAELATSMPTSNARPLRPQIAPGSDDIEQLCGEYVGRDGTIAEFRMEGADLGFQIDGVEMPIRLVGERTFMVETGDRKTYQFLVDDVREGKICLQCTDDGNVRYRNDVPPLASDLPQTAEGVWHRSYIVRMNGMPVQRIRLILDGGVFILAEEDATPVQLREYQPVILYSAMGEVLDLTGNLPAYANIVLHPIQGDPSN